MKKQTLLILAVLSISLSSFAQMPDFSERCKSEMQKLAFFVGDWKGTAVHNSREGQITIMQSEHIEWKLQETVLTIEGTGIQKNRQNGMEEIAFQALAVINFDPMDNEFKFKSFVKEGHSTDAYFKVDEDNKFEWGFDIPTGGKVRYKITLDEEKNTWYEIGEYSPDGTQWIKTIEMNLEKEQ